MMKNSIRQMFRMPVKAFLFFLLLSAAALLLALGGNLYVMTGDNLKHFDRIFTTIGTVTQSPEMISEIKVWDADKQDYTIYNRPAYGERLEESILNFDGAEYLSGPENRPVFVSLDDSYMLYDRETAGSGGGSTSAIVEVQPLEDCVPAGPVKLKLVRTLYSYFPMNTTEIYFCDHENENPQKLMADKTYIMSVQQGIPHGWFTGNPGPYEYVPCTPPSSSQCNEAGERLQCTLSGNYIEEVTEDFYTTETGKAWMELAKAYRMIDYSIPVTPVSDINLLMPFYNGDAYIAKGRTFDQEDYLQGKKVCLVPEFFARNNKLEVGDTLPLSLVTAGFGYSSQMYLPGGYLNAQGKCYQPFSEGDYEIIGIYQLAPGASRYGDYDLETNEVLIPDTAVTEDFSDNISGYAPMKGYRVSFRIPNGTIAKYQENWAKQGIGGLDIQFYDKGYTRLQEHLEGIRRIAVVLAVSGAAVTLLILVFFCHLFIAGQSRRTAIERSLGVSRRKCMISLMTGILLLAAAGGVTGSIAGSRMTDTVAERMEPAGEFDRKFSDGVLEADSGDDETQIDTSVSPAVPAVAGLLVFTAAGLIAYIMMRENLKKEPVALLSA